MIVEMRLVGWSKINEARLLQRSATLKLWKEGRREHRILEGGVCALKNVNLGSLVSPRSDRINKALKNKANSNQFP